MTSQLCCLHRNVYASLNASLKLTLNAKILLTKTAIHKYKQLFGFIRAKINLKKKKTQRKKWQIGHKMQTKPIHFLVLNLKKMFI